MEAHTPRIMAGWISQCVYVSLYACCESAGGGAGEMGGWRGRVDGECRAMG